MASDQPLSVFVSFSHRDEDLRRRLESHLALLGREGRIALWHDRKIGAGEEWGSRISGHLEAADLVLLLVSADFLASKYCYEIEMQRALQRHGEGTARVVPVLLRPCDWQEAPFARFQALPLDGRPVTSWADEDAAWTAVAEGLRALVDDIRKRRAGAEPEPRYPNARIRGWSRQLRDAYRRLEEVTVVGGDVATIEEEIADLRRRLREGDLQAGDNLDGGRLQLIAEIGAGGFATVWKAWDRRRRILVAVKVLHARYARDASRCERFFRGVHRMAELRHPGVVRVLDERGRDGRFHFFVMELVDDGDFHRAVLAGRFPEVGQRLRLVGEVGEALAHAHERGVVHRDVKPQNVLLDGAGRARLTDFDLVRAVDSAARTRIGSMLGTWGYAAPEVMFNAKEAGVPADVYGLAMTAVFALHGQDLPPDVIRDAPGFVRGLDAGEAVREVLARAVAFNLEERFASVEEFCDALRGALQLATKEPVEVGPAAPKGRHLLDERLLVHGIPWAAELLRRLHSDGVELVSLRKFGTDRWHLQIRLPAELRDLYGTASEVLLLAAADEIRGEDLKRAEQELLHREYDLDPDLLIVADGSSELEDRLAQIYQLWGQWVPWPLIDGTLPPLAAQFRPHLSAYDIFETRLPARGRQVIGRGALVADLSKRLQRGQSLGIFGLRKIGKTTLCRAVTDKLDPVTRLSDPGIWWRSGGVTVPVIWLDVQELCQRNLESLAAQLVRDLEDRLRRESIDPLWRPLTEDPLADLNRLLEVALQQAPWPIAVVFDEYDLLFESDDGDPAIAGIDRLFRMFRAHAQAQEPSRLAVVVIGRDSEFFDRPEMNGRPNPMLSWFVPRWLGPMDAADADELLCRLGRRVGLDVGEETAILARRWTGGHPLLHRQLGSAFLEVARGRRQEGEHIPTDPFCSEAIDLFVDRDHVLTTLREVHFLLSKRYPEASLHLHHLGRAPARDLSGAVRGAGGWHRPSIRTLRKFGLLLGSPDRPYIPELLRWYSRTFVPDLDRIAV